ncbi:MAG: T9SS type A sorting domain-containing protein [Crocinitomicaceae bacterium]|nr:PKD domain-containing protein [Flavobacteriales bacterium]NQZ37901.1 T9SS type A sorting domain-containing protein [Crocinitomicaceae bacterium]
MKQIILLFALASLSFHSKAQDSVSILFIGNSYTGYNSLPTIVNDIAISLGDQVTFDSHTPGGQSFSSHAVNVTANNKIKAQPWDFVVLQAQSQEPSFSDAQVNSQTLPFAIQLADSIYANNFCSEALFFMTWGRENGDPQWAPISTFDGMNGRLRNAYMRFADSVDGAVSPVGSAWKNIRDTYPSINLYAGDGSHPSYAGSYLAACTFYASTFRKSPVGASFIGTLDPVTAERLQIAAATTVLDSLEQWNLRPISEHTQAEFSSSVVGLMTNFTNMSTKATNYIWDFGDGSPISTDENPSYTYAADGTYSVQLIAESPCDSDTIFSEITIGSIGLNELDLKIQVASFGNGEFELTTKSNLLSVSVRDASGKLMSVNVDMNATTARVNLSELSAGVYFVSVRTEKGHSTLRLLR